MSKVSSVADLRQNGWSRQSNEVAFTEGFVFPDRETETEVAAAFIRKVTFPDRDRVDVPDRAFRFLDQAKRNDQRVDELLEVILEEREVHEVVLDHVGVGLVAGSYKNYVVGLTSRQFSSVCPGCYEQKPVEDFGVRGGIALIL